MTGDDAAGYLSGLPADQAAALARVNGAGLTALREYLASGEAVAFLGAGVSAPLYPLWDGLIAELIDAAEAADRLTPEQVAACRATARTRPESVVEIVRRNVGPSAWPAVLRKVLRARADSETGRTWTPVHELICRCAFKAVVTTNYDPGIVDARMRVRPEAISTGFTTWQDELGLDGWRTGDVFGEIELPVLFAHGQHNRPDSIVLATTEYRRAYEGKLPKVLARLFDGHLAWIGFSFADQRIAAILREVANTTGTTLDPGGDPRHVALLAWDPDADGNDPHTLSLQAEIEYGARAILYPARGSDHSALARLLATLTDPKFPPAPATPALPPIDAPAEPPAGGPANGETAGADAHTGGSGVPVRWVPAAERVPHFTGRAEELARLDRWAADPQVSLIGVSAWGGAGKTALVTRWVDASGPAARPGVRGVFGWSFYADPSAEHWAEALLAWARDELGITPPDQSRPAAAVLALLRAVPLLLILDGLEVVQEGPAGDGFGRLLDGMLREVLAGACYWLHDGLIVLTSRFPFADLETFDGGRARMLEVPPFTPAEGAALLAAGGGDWLSEAERRALVRAMDGHALAVGVLAGLLADRPPEIDLAVLRADLVTATHTDARVGKVLDFYAARLADPDRYLLAAVSLFARPVPAEAVLTVAGHEAFGGRLADWTPSRVLTTVRTRLAGLASAHPGGTVSAHPLVRDAFRPLALAAAQIAAESALGAVPAGKVINRADALQLVEAIELLLDAGHWQAADDLYEIRSESGRVWRHLPAAKLGHRAAAAFVATPTRRAACDANLGFRRFNFYLNGVGLYAMNAGDLITARDYLGQRVRLGREVAEAGKPMNALLNLAQCLALLGLVDQAQHAASESLNYAEASDDGEGVIHAHSCLGWLATRAGDSEEAEQHFLTADVLEVAEDVERDHLYSSSGIWWAEWLLRTGRLASAKVLTQRNTVICKEYGWNDVLARCHHILGRLARAEMAVTVATEHLITAANFLRDGDCLIDLADVLADLAESARIDGDLDVAERCVAEALALAAPCRLVSAHSAALAARARIRASQAAAVPGWLASGRDDADAALRLATQHGLVWHELDALRAHALLDQAEGADHGWTGRANDLDARLVPPGLDPDPLATVERLVAEARASAADSAGSED